MGFKLNEFRLTMIDSLKGCDECALYPQQHLPDTLASMLGS